MYIPRLEFKFVHAGTIVTMITNFCTVSQPSASFVTYPLLSPATHSTVTISVCNPDYTACDYLHCEILAIKYDTYIRIILTCSLIHVVLLPEVTVSMCWCMYNNNRFPSTMEFNGSQWHPYSPDLIMSKIRAL